MAKNKIDAVSMFKSMQKIEPKMTKGVEETATNELVNSVESTCHTLR